MPEPYGGPDYLDWFLQEISGGEAELNTQIVLKRARQALELQSLADNTRV